MGVVREKAKELEPARNRARELIGQGVLEPKRIRNMLEAKGHHVLLSNVNNWYYRAKRAANKPHVASVPFPIEAAPGGQRAPQEAPRMVRAPGPEVKAIDRAEDTGAKASPEPKANHGLWDAVVEAAPNQEDIRLTAALALMEQVVQLKGENQELLRQRDDWKVEAESTIATGKVSQAMVGGRIDGLLGQLESARKLVDSLFPMDVLEADLFRLIAAGRITDDANLDRHQIRATRRLYRAGLIDAVPVEGSDAAVDGLSLSEMGRRYLTLMWGKTVWSE